MSTPINERTFVMVKPDGVQRGLVGEIIRRFEAKGFKLVGIKMLTPSIELIEAHYAEHKSKPFFKGLANFMISSPVVAMCWEGRRVIDAARKLVGETKPIESAPGTIRGDFGIDVGRNVIHASDSINSSNKELGIWFKQGELIDWKASNEINIYEF